MTIDERQLAQLTDEVDQLHHESMRSLRDEFGDTHLDAVRRGGPSRRAFLRRAATGGAVLGVGSLLVPVGSFLPAAWAQESTDEEIIREGDEAIAAFAAGLELAAVGVYVAAIETGLLSNSALSLARLFAGHHQDHADALNLLLGEAPVADPNTAVLDAFGPQIAAATDEAGVLEVAYTIENAAAATYLAALGEFVNEHDALAAATILPVEAQHAVVLGTALGKPTDEVLPAFETTDAALDPAEYPA